MPQLKIIGDAPCPECVKRGKDRTGNHLILLENDKGEQFGKCNRCGYYSPSEIKVTPSERKTKTEAEIQQELEEISACPIRELRSRAVLEEVAKRFGVRSGLSMEDGKTCIQHFYPKTKMGKIVGYKVRNLDPKYFYSVGEAKDCEPFGYPQAQQTDTSRRKIVITEDELSAMSVYQVLDRFQGDQWKHIKPCVIALPDGAGSAVKCISNIMKFLSEFEEVILNFDSDDAGRKAAQQVLSLLPKARTVFLPLKDANDMLMAGRERELNAEILFHAKRNKPEGVVSVLDVLDEALEKPVWGLSYPWESLTSLTYGQRLGELVAIGGGVGIGKTLLAHEIAAWNSQVHNQNCFMIMLEESNGDTVKNVAGKIDSIPYHRPDSLFDIERLTGTAKTINDKIFLWKSNINQESRYNIEAIIAAIRYQAIVNNVKHVFFDNVTAVTQHLTPAEINTEVGRIAMQFAGLADELGIQIFIFSHLNTPQTGKSHEEGGEVREYQFTGSRALIRWCQVVIGFERNKQALDEFKHFSLIRLLKHRKYGLTGITKTKYDTITGKLVQQVDQAEEVLEKDEQQF